MSVEHVEVLVEERSTEAALANLLPKVLGTLSFTLHPHQGKGDLLAKLPGKLRGYSSWLPDTWRIVVLVDRDDENCVKLKARLEAMARDAKVRTRTISRDRWTVVNRVAVEEVEAWFFGDWEAVRSAYPRAPATIPTQAAFRHPDKILGGTAEALERVLQRAGYFAGGLRKIKAARMISARMDPARNSSPSFRALLSALKEIAG